MKVPMKDLKLLFIPFLVIASSTAKAAWGDQVGSFNGVIAYSNGSVNYNSGQHNVVNGYTTGLEWQCVEYVRRYYWIIYGQQIGAGMNANGFYNNGWGLTKAVNGGNKAPVPGSILCSASGSFGHVSIVREVGSNYIKVIQQNWSNTSSDNAYTLNMTVSNGNYTVKAAGSYSWQGWLLPPGGGVAPASIAWVSQPINNRWYRSDERLVYHVSGDRPNTVLELIDGNIGSTYDTSDGYIALSYSSPGWHFYEASAYNSANSNNYSYTGRWDGGWDPNPPSASRTDGAAPETWYHSDQTVTVKGSDALSGVKSCHYKWDDNPFSNWVGTDTLSAPLLPGKHRLYVEVEDHAFTGTDELGNRATIDLGEYWLDTNAATVQVSSRLVSSASETQVEVTITNPNVSPVGDVGIDLVQLGSAKASEPTWTPGSIAGNSSVKKTFTFPIGFGSNKMLLLSANYHLGANKLRLKSRIPKA